MSELQLMTMSTSELTEEVAKDQASEHQLCLQSVLMFKESL